MSKYSGLFTLEYGGVVIAWADDFEPLYSEKADLIYYSRVRCPELLEVRFKGSWWIFDYIKTRKDANEYLVRHLCYPHF